MISKWSIAFQEIKVSLAGIRNREKGVSRKFKLVERKLRNARLKVDLTYRITEHMNMSWEYCGTAGWTIVVRGSEGYKAWSILTPEEKVVMSTYLDDFVVDVMKQTAAIYNRICSIDVH